MSLLVDDRWHRQDMLSICPVVWVSVIQEGGQYEPLPKSSCGCLSIDPSYLGDLMRARVSRQDMEASSPYMESDSGGEGGTKGKSKAASDVFKLNTKDKKRVSIFKSDIPAGNDVQSMHES